ncbi:MarR family winged helix-turn-helix transcriptional regulator [Neolewinella antarctica]|uniref:DNA-binding MarR family transcriptional regulator n=1 Tax=Neolewinella antarctica TaxID=442734 RepID=A0ABX0X913_9BACT|nr:MarR family transcriptional regulator [Neolewinella antarctica]NJC25755.1 DNA-binding MarR family transcriptional regulator [Neolewinella antarctica]
MQEPLAYENVGTLLDRTTRLMKAMYQRAFREAGYNLTPEQWVLIDHLSNNGPASQTDLANGTFKDAPTVSRIIDKLTKKEFVARTRFPNDRRRYQIALTAYGEETHSVLNPLVKELRIQTWGGLTEGDHDELSRILDTIRDNFA